MMTTTRCIIRIIVAVAGVLFLARGVAAQTETVEYYGLDALGSVRVVFDASGNVLGRADYGPFGESLVTGSGMPSRAYAGLFRDGEAGLDHAEARSYQSRTGRFSSVDPVYDGVFEPQRWNRYSYAANSPVMVTDPSGLNLQAQSNPGCSTFPDDSYCQVQLLMDLWWYFGGAGGGGAASGGGGYYGGGGGTRPGTPTNPPEPPTSPPTNPPGNPPEPSKTPPDTTKTEPPKKDVATCYSRWSFSSVIGREFGGSAGTVAAVIEVGAPMSFLSDAAAIEAKGAGALGTRNPYASGLNRMIRAASPRLISPRTMGNLVAIGDRVTPSLAVAGVFTAAYNGSTIIQCSLGLLR